jgi:2-haloacid dehalogenase
MKKISNIKVIAFDAYGTCFDVNSASKILKKQLGKKWFEFSTLWRTRQLEYTWLRSLMGKHVDFWKVTEDSLDYTLENFKVSRKVRSKLLRLYKVLSPFADLRITIKMLKLKNIKTCILSNGSPSLLKTLIKNAKCENLFDRLISIEKVKIYKPHPKVYELVTKQYHCKPKQVCFISSNPWDVVGGGVYGFNSVWVNRNNATFDRLGFKAKYTINKLSELIYLIK